MKHCHTCDLEFPLSYRFCGSCGGSLSDLLTCQGCGDLIEAKWAFCTNCGTKVSANGSAQAFSVEVAESPKIPVTAALPSSMLPQQTQSSHHPERESNNYREWYAAPELFEETGETTATPISPRAVTSKAVFAAEQQPAPRQSANGKAPPTLTMLSAYGEPSVAARPGSQGPRALLAVAALLVLFAAVGFGFVYWWTRQTSSAHSTASAAKKNDFAAGAEFSASSATPAQTERSIASADDELKRLRERRIAAKPSEASDVIYSLEEAEKKYPDDYRFSYERAKLSIKGIVNHHETFEALSLAGTKAIDNGKAQEMLDNLTADKDGDFWKPSHGHREWDLLLKGLSNRDKRILGELRH